jgi:Tfp pilus assembly protein PilF
MERAAAPGPDRARFAWLSSLPAAAVLTAALIGLFLWAGSGSDNNPRREREPTAPPLRSFTSPFLNTRPGVNYVGDAACATCHRPHAKSYRQHPMGQSFAPVSAWLDKERLDAKAGNPFEARGLLFGAAIRDGKMFHREVLRDQKGNDLVVAETEVHYVMGSNKQGRSYLINRDGRLYQSSLSWYSSKEAWDLAPGYRAKLEHFSRPVVGRCVFCHCNDAAPVKDTLNSYHEPLFRQHAIGCERCHGPGELHVAGRRRGESPEGIDHTIVNPHHLEPSLREAVCQQCHLQGLTAVEARGRSLFDYRPGLPLHHFVSVFVKRPELFDPAEAISHPEQMHASRCFTRSGGKLGCASCHDPHAVPAAEEKIAFYRDRCLQCHQPTSCSLPPADPRRRDRSDSCTACHMPAKTSSNIAHSSITDHRILRRPDQAPKLSTAPVPGGVPLLHFHHDLLEPRDPEGERDLGLAMTQMAEFESHPGLQEKIARMAQPLLSKAVRRDPADLAAAEGLAYALWKQGRSAEALEVLHGVLKRKPDREGALRVAAPVADRLGRRDEALKYRRALLAINPVEAEYHFGLAQTHARHEEWSQARQAAEAALRLDPVHVGARVTRILCDLREGHPDRARAELDLVLRLDPDGADELRRWFVRAQGR